MKDDLIFVLKMLGLTALVVVIFQVRTGGQTIEEHFDSFLKTSILVDYIQEATDGGIALGKKGYQKADVSLHAIMGRLKRKKDQPKGLKVAAKHDVEEEEMKVESKVEEKVEDKVDKAIVHSRLYLNRLRRAQEAQ
jgi:hypothetical protein